MINIALGKLAIYLVSLVGAGLLSLLNFSIRWKRVGFDGTEASWPAGDPRIIIFWHGQQLLMPWIYRHFKTPLARRITVLSSHHKDGRFAASILNRLGVDSIYGSSTRGGREALFKLIARLQHGSHIAITPDGPKGPPEKIKPGIIRIAQRSGAPIYPAAISADNKWVLGSWDKMFLPKPFGRALLIMGDPIFIPKEFSNEDELMKHTQIVQEALDKVTSRANEYWEQKAHSA